MLFMTVIFAPAHSFVTADEKQKNPAQANAASIRTAERNIQTPQGNFRVRMRQSPSDPRAGEEAQFNVDFAERIEGGFGGSEPQPIEEAMVTARVTTAAGDALAANIASHAGGAGSYALNYKFETDGNYKIIFDVKTADNRQFTADFPVTVVGAPINWLFWLG
jgi:hypothetical protein